MINKKVGWFISWGGLGLQLAGRIPGRLRDFGYIEQIPFPEDFRQALALLGSLLLILGLSFVARSKGRTWVWGLTGFFSFAGMIFVAFISEKKAIPEAGKGSQPLL
ncbi:hypothetical protein ACJJIU_01485 [Microbulbifer sp. CnH-101-E]|uniref:hypothetical protein n=1 Tax=unclassified Microbulbifer TaxID=2619833 RepID=UPI00403A4D23